MQYKTNKIDLGLEGGFASLVIRGNANPVLSDWIRYAYEFAWDYFHVIVNSLIETFLTTVSLILVFHDF